MSTTTVPADRAAAINALVELDVAKWGEGEREASRALHARTTYGLALNTLACRTNDPTIAKAAKAALTPADRKVLRNGG